MSVGFMEKLPPGLAGKYRRLVNILESVPSAVIAFSGGLDSSFLCFTASRHVPGRVLCLTVTGGFSPAADLEFAGKFAVRHGLEHMLIPIEIPPEVRRNTEERCYLCKKHILQLVQEVRQTERLDALLDGENHSDSTEDRPGRRAAREMGTRSPLAEAGLTKDDIMELARVTGIPDAVRPASACLLTRVPTGTSIDDEILVRIDLTEGLIRSSGISIVRARQDGRGTRIELGQAENVPRNHELIKSLEAEIIALGWAFVRIDPGGYVSPGRRRKPDDG